MEMFRRKLKQGYKKKKLGECLKRNLIFKYLHLKKVEF